jgi:hypothetical protein
MHRLLRAFAMLTAVFVLLGPLVPRIAAQDEPAAPEPAAAQIDEKADAVLRAAAAHLAKQKRFRFLVHQTRTTTSAGIDHQESSGYLYAVARPGKLAVVLQEGDDGFTLVSNGEKLLYHVPITGRYLRMDAPKTIDALLSNDEDLSAFAASDTMGAIVLVHSKPYETVMKGVRSLRYIGRQTQGEYECDRVRLTVDLKKAGDAIGDGVSFNMPLRFLEYDAWITVGPEPTLHRLSPNMNAVLAEVIKRTPEGPQADRLRRMSIESVIRFDVWDFSGEVDDETFSVEPPAGAKPAESWEELFSED